jgi:hypothetical protein
LVWQCSSAYRTMNEHCIEHMFDTIHGSCPTPAGSIAFITRGDIEPPRYRRPLAPTADLSRSILIAGSMAKGVGCRL